MTLPDAVDLTAPYARPLVLLPVRLETRYTADGTGLRVRVYPDDLHVDRLDRGLDDAERAAGVAYWQQVRAGTPVEQAYAVLQQAVRPDRAAWVATALTPPGPGIAPETADPVVPTRRRPAPVARALPDRFVGMLYQGRDLVGVGGSTPVVNPLVMGARPDGGFVEAASGLRVPEGAEWTVDHAAAEAAGMAFTVPVDGHSGPFRLLVFGVRGDDGRAELESLLTAHRVTGGVEFLAPGTPTNNTEHDRSTWHHRRPPSPPAENLTAPPSDADGPRLSAALGIDPAVLAGLDGADRTGERLARAAHVTIWPASWDSYLDTATMPTPTGPTLGEDTRSALRDTFERDVRGGGPLPALRIGNQPYGVLPVVATGGPAEVSGTMPGLQRTLDKARGTLAATSDAPTAATNLLDVLGTAPTMLGVRMRAGLPDLDELIAAMTIYDPLGGDLPQYSQEIALRDALAAEYGLNFGRLGYVSFGSVTRPLLLPLVADGDDGDQRFARSLVAGQDRRITTVLQALIEMGHEAESRTLRHATGGDLPAAVAALEPALAADVEHVLGTAQPDVDLLRSVADRLAARFGHAGPGTLAQYQPFAALRTSLLAEGRARGSDALLVAALQAWCRALFHTSRFEQALLELVAAPLEQRRIAVAQALDCCSHRLDAWLTSLSTVRLRGLRARAATGLTLGAYGWVDELPGPGAPRPPRGGYVHAPSLAQAATAGVLRSANLAHRGQAFAVDLSGERIRTGLQLLDGVRQGQPLGAVLGYRVERALHEGGLGRFVLSLRGAAPLAADTPDGARASDAVTRAGILDGVRLLDLSRDQVRAALMRTPDNPYLTEPWTVSDDELARVAAVLDDAAAAHDAAADLMLAESVHQMVSGGTARAAANLDAAAGADVPPPEPEFARTPTLGVALTHRLLVLAGGPATASETGWASEGPLAAAEPWLERWLRTRLGPATGIEVAPGVGLEQAGLSASDLVYASGDPARLHRLLRAARPDLGDTLRTALSGDGPRTAAAPARAPGAQRPEADTAWAGPLRRLVARADSLRRLLVASRPLQPLDLAASGADASHTVDTADLSARINAALATLRAAADDNQDDGEPPALTLARFGIDPADLPAAKAVAQRRAQKAEQLRPDWPAVAQSIFGADFRLLPRLVPRMPLGVGDPFARRLGAVAADRSQLGRFLHDAATVRTAVARHTDTLLHADAAATAYRLRVAQFGGAAAGQHRAADAAHWLGLPFGDGSPPPDKPATCLVVDADDEVTEGAAVAGLLVDEWVEVVPRRRADGRQLLTSGVAVHADAPAARAPQAILLAVPPTDTDWTADLLAATLTQTLDLARLRATTLEFSSWLGRVLPALMFPAFSLAGERVLDFKQLAAQPLDNPVPFVGD
ncbi:hypothetical protein [Catellatospora sp. NPDC049133]|uniref:hypothetical protein n=1 Tax=Catellatospora sp. NPDC049133 TaxID=3155499 RepID=UPI0033C6C791